MPRTLSMSVPAGRSRDFAERLGRLDGTLSVRLHAGVSVQPEGDVVEAEVLDRSLPAAMRLADEFGLGSHPSVSLTTTAPVSVVSPGSITAILRDRSAASWEEVELTLGRESAMTPGKTLVMALAGVIAAAGVITGALHVVVGAMIIVPGFEPLVRVALGLVHRQRSWRDGVVDAARGYGALLLGAGVCAAILTLAGTPLPAGGESYHAGSALLSYWTSTTLSSAPITAAAGVAGALLVIARRQVLTAGVMVALALVPALTLAAAAALAGQWGTLGRALLRWLLDVALVIAGSAVVLQVKRHTDQRAPSSDDRAAPIRDEG